MTSLAALRVLDIGKWRSTIENAIRATSNLVEASVFLGVSYRTLSRWVCDDEYLRLAHPQRRPGRPKKTGADGPGERAKRPDDKG